MIGLHIKMLKKPNHNRVKLLYDWKLTYIGLEGVNLDLLEGKRAKNQQSVQKFKKMISLHIKMLKKPNHNKVKSLYDWKLTYIGLEGVNLHLLEENRANNQQKAKKLKKWMVYILKDAKKA